MSLAERAIWEELWTGYLDFYDTKISQQTNSITWARLHDPNEPMYLLAASLAGRIVVIVHYLYHRSCWTVGDYCYLQDLCWGRAHQTGRENRARRRREPDLLADQRRQCVRARALR